MIRLSGVIQTCPFGMSEVRLMDAVVEESGH